MGRHKHKNAVHHYWHHREDILLFVLPQQHAIMRGLSDPTKYDVRDPKNNLKLLYQFDDENLYYLLPPYQKRVFSVAWRDIWTIQEWNADPSKNPMTYLHPPSDAEIAELLDG